MQVQFKAGYIADSIAKIITDEKSKLDTNVPSDSEKQNQIYGLLQYVSSFDVEFPYSHKPDSKTLNPVLATLNNIITRGLPTRAPLELEQLFAKIGLTKRDDEKFELNFTKILTQQFNYQTVFELLHIIEPELHIGKENYGGQLGSDGEWYFLDTELNKFPFCKQILQSQRKFATINRNLGGGRSVDFSFEFPYKNAQSDKAKKRGVIFEFDGSHHKINAYKYYDKYRDNAAEEENFETLRQLFDKIELDKAIENQFRKEIFDIFAKNFQRKSDDYLATYSLIFIPLAVARIHKTLIEYLLVHPELFEKSKITVGIIERDVPCGAIAIQTLRALFAHINALLKQDNRLLLPKIELTVFENHKWVYDKQLHLKAAVKNGDYFKNNEFDIIIDHSVLRRSGIYKEPDYQNDKAIKIRSSHYFDTSFGNSRRVYCADLLEYNSLVKKQNDGSYIPVKQFENHINFFIQNIFRKVALREGQLPIISRALQSKPVIGLLPTGGGKSLTYQMPAFLQPGLCLIVDPIKSLMEDQVRVLKDSWIDCCNYINSNLEREKKATRLIDFRLGETQFLFISPERFVMQDFRDIASKIDSRFGLAFSFCVIDEVHCVSEWGHDFRPTYLMLGENAQRFSKTRGVNPVTLVGLTATASFDVLADIERELKIEHYDVANAIIMIENTIRPELFFRVIDVTHEEYLKLDNGTIITGRMKELNKDFARIGQNLEKLNNEDLLKQSINDHNQHFEQTDSTPESLMLQIDNLEERTQNDFCSIVFCPVKGHGHFDNREQQRNNATIDNMRGANIQQTIKEWIPGKNKQGVDYVYENLDSDSKGYFYATETEGQNVEVQKHFNDFTSGKTKHIVCTKAFGMGIDKKNIRLTYHFVYAGSLESLVQEAGRAGRDKKIALSSIIVSLEKAFVINKDCLLKEFPDTRENNPIKNKFHRKTIRRELLYPKLFSTKESVAEKIKEVIGNLKTRKNKGMIPLPKQQKDDLLHRLECFISDNGYCDRQIHDYFFDGSFKGKDIEYSQLYSLFNEQEFERQDNLSLFNQEYNEINKTSITLRYWTKNDIKRLYIQGQDLNVYIDLNKPKTNNQFYDNVLLFFLGKTKNKSINELIKLIEGKEIKKLNRGSLKEVFNDAEEGLFDFSITAEKEYLDNEDIIVILFSILGNYQKNEMIKQIKDSFDKDWNNIFKPSNPNQIIFKWFYIYSEEKIIEALKEAHKEQNAELFLNIIFSYQINKCRDKSKGNFHDFLLLLEENIDKLNFNFKSNNKKEERWLKYYFYRDRNHKPNNDTGKLIYRMHSMGLLKDYLIDYNKNNMYSCSFMKYSTIDKYVKEIEQYLRRYLSEQTAIQEIEKLKSRLYKDTLIDNILECLYYLSEFSYQEIAGKRKRATDEIEAIINESITNQEYTTDWYKQNHYIKEQIYFYFNAKYARLDYKIDNKPYSLLDDYQTNNDNKQDILAKYLDVFRKEGTEQNNYKHMIGSCKKILRSLSETDLQKEWLLHLLRAFAMYAVNNQSYISEANEELELGFDNLYKDGQYHNNDFSLIEPIFSSYFDKLEQNIKPDNHSFNDIRLIRVKLLLKLQTIGIENFINKNNQLKS